ncbi:MAG: FkbM family methyltransferase [Pseudomonadales bacterium]
MEEAQINVVKVPFDGVELLYEASNKMVVWRAQTVFSKEPDTVAWIRQFKPGEVFVDIGANVGMYTIMAAKGQGVRVFAFEPESQNYALLNRNIVYNGLHEQCVAYPLALSNEARVDRLYLSAFSLGGSCHTFGASLDFHLKERKQSFVQGCVAMPLDDLVAQGVLPQPDHVKIDVDGLEHLVMQGAASVLRSPGLKSLLVELNTHLPEHRELIALMGDLGFEFQQHQVDVAIRTEGSFQGIGNYVFFRPGSGISFEGLGVAPPAEIDYDAVKRHVAERFASMAIQLEPYPHFYVRDVFPVDYYRRMMAMKPDNEELICLNDTGRASGFPERYVMHLREHLANLRNEEKRRFWEKHREWFCSDELMVVLVRRFYDQLIARGDSNLRIEPEAMFMRDFSGYMIGPHTDSPKRLVTMMLYLPDDRQHRHLGTTVYVPKQAGQICDGQAHHKFEYFDPVGTAEYLPNTAFGFLKSDNSFHGVPCMSDDYQRDTMVYIVKRKAA